MTSTLALVPTTRRSTVAKPKTPTFVKEDRRVVTASMLYATAMLVLLILQYSITGTYGALPFICPLLFFCHLARIRHSLADPLTIALLFAFIYSAFPIMFAQPYTASTLSFALDGAAAIYAVGTLSMIAGVGIAVTIIRERPSQRQNARSQPNINNSLLIAGLSLSVLSCLFTAAYVIKAGAVLLGSFSYGDSFQVRMERGMGIFMLSIPMAAGGLAMMIASQAKLRTYHHLVGLSAFAALYVAHSQRKYLIIPAIFYLARYWHVRSALRLVALLLASAIGISLFMYLGSLRFYSIPTSEALSSQAVDRFVDDGSDSFAGESAAVFATAAAAADGFIKPLPHAGDYLDSWKMSLPNFIFGYSFDNVNDRFTRAYNPAYAAGGGGYGFSFFGEAYLVGGYPLLVLLSVAMMAVFRWFYIKGGRSNHQGLAGAISLAAIPFAFWFQRNSFAYFVKEFLYLQIGTIAIAYYAVKFFTLPRRKPRNNYPPLTRMFPEFPNV